MNLINFGKIYYVNRQWKSVVDSMPLHGIYHQVLPRTEQTIVFLQGKIIQRFIYPRIVRVFKSRMINDYNLHFTGGWTWYSSAVIEQDALVDRVIKGLKPAGFIRSIDYNRCLVLQQKAKQAGLLTKLHEIPDLKGMRELGMARGGTFSTNFDLDAIVADYTSWGFNYQIKKIKNDFSSVPLSKLLSGFDYGNVKSIQETMLTGLLLGYPLETTCAFIRGSIRPIYKD